MVLRLDAAGVTLVSGPNTFGPLPLKSAGENAWTFAIEPISRTSGSTTTVMQPMSAQRSPQYVIDPQGRLFAPKYVELRTKGEVTIKRQGSALVAHGLWMNVETTKFDKEMKALEQKMTPVETAFDLAPLMPAVAEKTTLSGSLALPEPSESWRVTVVRLKAATDEFEMGFDFPNAKPDAQGRFSISVPRAFAEESWSRGYGDFGVTLGKGAMHQDLLKAGGRAARFKLSAAKPAIDLGALTTPRPGGP
ncbi:MAG TPA: hypothetical protein VG323_15110 [Thermoanaerobaculia bacterium]|nr:hypothetical protein [Thermoanaerobaculia bacterium]